MCGECVKGFFKEKGACKKCNEEAGILFYILISAGLTVFCCLVMFAWKLHPHIPAQTYGSNSILVAFTQTVALVRFEMATFPSIYV